MAQRQGWQEEVGHGTGTVWGGGGVTDGAKSQGNKVREGDRKRLVTDQMASIRTGLIFCL